MFHPWASEVCLSPASWGGHFFKSRLTVPAFPGPEAALPSPQFDPVLLDGSIRFFTFITYQLPQLVEETWREMPSCFLLIFSAFCLAPSSCLSSLVLLLLFPSHRTKSVHFYDSQQNWICLSLQWERGIAFPSNIIRCVHGPAECVCSSPPTLNVLRILAHNKCLCTGESVSCPARLDP